MVGFHEVIDREEVLPFEEAGAASDNLLELDHGIDRAHEDDISDVASINTG